MLSCNDNSFKNIIHNLSRYEFVNRIAPKIYAKPHPKRLNLGGVVLKESNVNFDCPLSPNELSDLLISYLEGTSFNQEIMQNFIKSLDKLRFEAPYRTRNVPNLTSGSAIINRLITISQYNAQNKEKEWSNDQIHYIDRLLLTKTDVITEINIKFLQCTESQLKNIIQLRTIELSKRSFTLEEDKFILQHVSDKTKNKDIANYLICRTTNDVKKRRNALKKMIKQGFK